MNLFQQDNPRRGSRNVQIRSGGKISTWITSNSYGAIWYLTKSFRPSVPTCHWLYSSLSWANNHLFLRTTSCLAQTHPYDIIQQVSANRVSGDGPEMKKATIARNVRFWMRDQFAAHYSPNFQLFIRLFGNPNVLASDFRESILIPMRRTKEFDRSKRSIKALSDLVANGRVAMKSSDSRFMQSEELVRDLKSPNFLH